MIFPRVLSKSIPDFHEEIYSLLGDRVALRKGIIAPRGFSKSTLASFVFPMHRILFSNPYEPLFIVLVSESQQQAINFLTNMRSALKYDPIVRYYFGDLMKGPMVKDTNDDLITNNMCRVLAMGTGQKVRGQQFMNCRPHIIILDDFESEFNSLTLENRRRNKQWVAAAVENSLADGGELVAIGTLIHEDAYLNDIQGDPAFKTLFYDSEVAEGVSLWPERFPWSRLKALENSLTARGMKHVYWQELRNQPVPESERRFRMEDMCYWDGHIELHDKETYLHLSWISTAGREELYDPPLIIPVDCTVGVDLAPGEFGDWNVVLPMLTDSEERKFVDDYTREHMDSELVIEELFRMQAKYNPSLFVIETVQYQEQVAVAFKKAMNKRKTWCAVKEEKPKKQKTKRHEAMIPDHRAHRIFIRKRHNEAEREMYGYPRGKNDDVLDGMWLAHRHSHAATHGPPTLVVGERTSAEIVYDTIDSIKLL